MKASQLERLRQLGELREKGLLTEDEFAQEKRALVGNGEPSSGTQRRAASRWAAHVAILLALVAAGVALYFALDARNQAKESATEATALRARVAAFKPTLILQGVYSRTARVPDDGYRHNVYARCPNGATAVGGGFAVRGAGPQVIASFAERFQWLIGAASSGGTSSVDSIAVCARGVGGLKILGRF